MGVANTAIRCASYAARASAIDVDDLAGHKTCALGAEKKDHRRDFFGCTDTAKRDAGDRTTVVMIGRDPARTRGGIAKTSPPRRVDRVRD